MICAKQDWTNWDAVWVVDSGGPKEACIRWGAHPHAKGQLLGERTCPGNARWHSAISCAKMAEPIDLPIWVVDSGGLKEPQVQLYLPGGTNVPWREGTFSQHGEYNWTVHLRRWCGLMSNYFDHLFYFLIRVIQQTLFFIIDMVISLIDKNHIKMSTSNH